MAAPKMGRVKKTWPKRKIVDATHIRRPRSKVATYRIDDLTHTIAHRPNNFLLLHFALSAQVEQIIHAILKHYLTFNIKYGALELT